MKGFVEDIEELTEENKDFRRVLYTGKHLQLVLMALKPGEEIGEEVHSDHDQFFRVEKGKGEVLIDGVRTKIKSDDAIIVPAGARHNVINTGEKPSWFRSCVSLNFLREQTQNMLFSRGFRDAAQQSAISEGSQRARVQQRIW